VHIYAFGSICRGDVSPGSDVDLLALVDRFDARFSPESYSIYSYRRIEELWKEGNPFAWHLYLEARLLYSSNTTDVLRAYGRPEPYRRCIGDCEKFLNLFSEATGSAKGDSATRVFDLSTVFLSVRNIATCFSLGVLGRPNFSRHSALHLGHQSLAIPTAPYEILERSRLLCTRGYGDNLTSEEVDMACGVFPNVEEWMSKLLVEVKHHEA
jgi:hypothetical protein